MDTLTVVLKNFHLIPATEVRNIGRDERELAGENFRRLGKAARGNSPFVHAVVFGLLRQRLFQQRGQFMELGLEDISRPGRGD
jgi:hypothetical protein